MLPAEHNLLFLLPTHFFYSYESNQLLDCLDQGSSANFFCQEPDSKYFRLGVHMTSVTIPQLCALLCCCRENATKGSKWAWWSSKKNFYKTGPRLDLVYGTQFVLLSPSWRHRPRHRLIGRSTRKLFYFSESPFFRVCNGNNAFYVFKFIAVQ